MADESKSITFFLDRRHSSNERERAEAWARIDQWLKTEIGPDGLLSPVFNARVGSSDVWQGALLLAAQDKKVFENRRQYLAWFRKILRRRASNTARFHKQEMRDVRCDVEQPRGDDSQNEKRFMLEQGRRPIAAAPARQESIAQNPEAEASDSSFGADAIRNHVYDDPPPEVVECYEAIEGLNSFDEQNGENLAEIFVWFLQGLSAAEIASRLSQQGVMWSVRKVERRREKIADLLGLAKPVTVRIVGRPDVSHECRRLVLPRVSAGRFLAQSRTSGYRLVRLGYGARPEHSFEQADELYGFVDPNDTLEARANS